MDYSNMQSVKHSIEKGELKTLYYLEPTFIAENIEELKKSLEKAVVKRGITAEQRDAMIEYLDEIAENIRPIADNIF